MGKTKTVEVNRSKLSALCSYTTTSAVILYFRKNLQYHLGPVFLSICNVDDTRHRTNKNKLREVLGDGVGILDKAVLFFFQNVFHCLILWPLSTQWFWNSHGCT